MDELVFFRLRRLPDEIFISWHESEGLRLSHGKPSLKYLLDLYHLLSSFGQDFHSCFSRNPMPPDIAQAEQEKPGAKRGQDDKIQAKGEHVRAVDRTVQDIRPIGQGQGEGHGF